MSSALAFVSDAAMLVLGGKLKRKETLSGRLADVLSQLYLASAAIKRFEDDKQPSSDLPLLQWSCDNALRVMQQSLDKFIINFPNRPVAWVIRRIVFPLGKTYSGPKDISGYKAADLLLNPSVARDRLTAGLYLPDTEQYRLSEPVSRLEYALHCVIAAEAAEKTLRSAVRDGKIAAATREQQIRQALELDIITSEDVNVLTTADAARREAIMVDDFEPRELVPRPEAADDHASPASAKECA
jgi:acyl-CoA dehydrogenase